MATRTYDRLVFTPGETFTVPAGDTVIVLNLDASDWSGTVGALVAFRSSIPGTQYTINIPADIALEYMNPQDCVITGGTITQTDSTDGGNNVGWDFPAAQSSGGAVGVNVSASTMLFMCD